MKETLINLFNKIKYDQEADIDSYVYRQFKDFESILDVGCGNGRFISLNPQKIWGIDNNEDNVNACKKRGYNVLKGDVTKMPYTNEKFYGVHCSHVIEHLPPKEAYKLLYEMNRILKVNGILCVRTPLFHKTFFNDFTHLKPYPPKALLHYLTKNYPQRTITNKIKGNYKILELKYRHSQLFRDTGISKFFFFVPLLNFLERMRIRSIERTGYLLILKKINKK
jgi:ubiquinone/menaquinone biosynthesis C-methylase UbiE